MRLVRLPAQTARANDGQQHGLSAGRQQYLSTGAESVQQQEDAQHEVDKSKDRPSLPYSKISRTLVEPSMRTTLPVTWHLTAALTNIYVALSSESTSECVSPCNAVPMLDVLA